MIQLQVDFDYPEMPMHFNIDIPKGQKVAVVGESGAGKSTLLNLIAGFEKASRGEIWLNGKNHTNSSISKRPVAMLFQDNNVFPHLTVSQNIGLGLTPSLKLNSEQTEKVTQIAKQMGIETFFNRRTSDLSGGQKQRVALARTLLQHHPILLLDEPFSALDPERRDELQALVNQLCEQNQLTLLMVTHQLNEVKDLFDRVITIENGHITNDQ